jgi:hypothetical protein
VAIGRLEKPSRVVPGGGGSSALFTGVNMRSRALWQVKRLRAIFLEEGQGAAFRRAITNTVRNLLARGPRFRPLIGDWLASLPEMQPITRDHSLYFTPDQLLWGDVGPANIPDDSAGGAEIKSPRRYALVVWPTASNWKGIPNTALIEARFTLVPPTGDGSGLLRLEAQDAMLSGELEDKRSPLRAEIAVSVNGVEIYAGNSEFPRDDWAAREFTIPPGVLGAGSNVVRIANRSGYNFWATTNWLCVSGLTVLLGDYVKREPVQRLKIDNTVIK